MRSLEVDEDAEEVREPMFDVVIVGAGPAGLNAALVLARCRRSIAVLDSGAPRNAASSGLHNYLGHEGISPRDFLALGRREVADYGVDVIDAEVDQVERVDEDEQTSDHFLVSTTAGHSYRARKLLIATGVKDLLPEIAGLRECYGQSVHHCPYCDGWERQGQNLVVIGEPDDAIGLALLVRCWSDRVTFLNHGGELRPDHIDRLEQCGIGYRQAPVASLRHDEGNLDAVLLVDGSEVRADAAFINTQQVQRFDLLSHLTAGNSSHVATSSKQRAKVPGLFVAGDADGDVQFAIVAAAEGATAAVAIHRELQEEDLGAESRRAAVVHSHFE